MFLCCQRRLHWTSWIHWTVIFLPKQSVPEFFDSLAKPPQVYGCNFADFLIQNGPKYLISRNEYSHQDLERVISFVSNIHIIGA